MKNKKDQLILGVDGGGTKTLAVIADCSGKVRGISKTGASNFQGIGIVRAGINLKEAVEGAIQSAKIDASQIIFANYGIAGADRDADFEIVHSYVKPANPAGGYQITNDTTIALRAGTKDGIGVALIAGTGSNTIGFSSDFRQKKVGGLGKFTGDYGSAIDIAEKGVLASMKYYDGRGPKTCMYEMFCDALAVEKLEDVIEFYYVDDWRPIQIDHYAPIVFEAANMGDNVALGILRKTGRQIGHEAVTCMKALFDKYDPIPVILGGSVYQKGGNPTLIESLSNYIRNVFPNATVTKLKQEPCLGALLLAIDCLQKKPAFDTVTKTLTSSLFRTLKTFEQE